MTAIENYILPLVTTLMVLTGLLFVWLISRPLKARQHEDGQYKMSYCVYVVGNLLGATFLIHDAINWIYPTLAANSKVPNTSLWDLWRSFFIFDGLSLFSLFFIFYISKLFLRLLFKRSASTAIELDQDEVGIFLIRTTLFIVCVWCFLPLFEQLLQVFKPDTGIMIYH